MKYQLEVCDYLSDVIFHFPRNETEFLVWINIKPKFNLVLRPQPFFIENLLICEFYQVYNCTN